MHALTPALTPALPLALDSAISVASLGAKYAATLLVGEPLSPEERLHSDELEALSLRPDAVGIEAWEPAGLRIPPAVRATRAG